MRSSVSARVIAFEFAPFPGGQGTYALEMSRALHRAGVSVEVLAANYGAELMEPYPIAYKLTHQKVNFGAALAVRSFLNVAPEDATVLACDIRAALLACVFKRPRQRVVSMFHGSEALKGSRSVVARSICMIVARCSDVTVANSQYTSTLVTDVTGVACSAALLGVSDFWLVPATGEFENASLRSIPASTMVFCTLGRLEPRKGQLDAIDAFTRLAPRHPGATYVIAGRVVDEAYGKAIMARIASSPADVRYVGTLSKDDVRRLYSRSTALILPARYEPSAVEGFGLVTLEAAAQGCPSIVTNVGGLAEAVVNQTTGIVCPAGDLEALIEAIEQLAANPENRMELAAGAGRRARSHTWARTVADTPFLGAIGVSSR